MNQQAAQRVSKRGTTPALTMPDQRLDKRFIDPAAPATTQTAIRQSRVMVLLTSAALCGVLLFLLLRPLQSAAMPAFGLLFLSGIVIVPFFWDAVAATMAIAGLLWKSRSNQGSAQPLRVAILVLLFDEPAETVIVRTVQLLASLDGKGIHSFSLHILSDSRQRHSVELERTAFEMAGRRHGHLNMSYVHRETNTDFKSGNIRNWIRSQGHLHEAMLVLDADSVMDGQSVCAMVDALSADPGCALVQSVPRVLPGRTRWQSMQSFASHYYGVNLGHGLDAVAADEANFYGHNAVVRVKAFADCAGLPHLGGEPPFGGVIMSHDFVEAALLRRANWSVRFMPDVSGSFEDAPETLFAHLARDRRWCHGNLQHFRLLGVPGLAWMSRFHLLQGAMTYLSAPLWLVAVALWTTLSVAFAYEVLLPSLMLITFVLLLPRICGLLTAAGKLSLHDLVFAVQELILSSLFAPILMVQRTMMILSIVSGKASVWDKPKSDQMSLRSAVRFHGVEIGLAMMLLTGWLTGHASSLIFTAAVPLSLAPFLSLAVSKRHANPIWSPSHEPQ